MSAQDLHKSQTPRSQGCPTFLVVTVIEVGTTPKVSDRKGFDVGDMLHSLAQFWSQERSCWIQVKTPVGLRVRAEESLVRQTLATTLANSLGLPARPGASQKDCQTELGQVVLIASEANGQVRVAVQANGSSTVMVLPKR